jgi:hypothetical protein
MSHPGGGCLLQQVRVWRGVSHTPPAACVGYPLISLVKIQMCELQFYTIANTDAISRKVCFSLSAFCQYMSTCSLYRCFSLISVGVFYFVGIVNLSQVYHPVVNKVVLPRTNFIETWHDIETGLSWYCWMRLCSAMIRQLII